MLQWQLMIPTIDVSSKFKNIVEMGKMVFVLEK